MLYLDAPIGPINGLTIFRDHANPSAFYYISERPRLSRNEGGRPEFVFLVYARDITDKMLLAAAAAIADVVQEPNPSFIVPSVFDAAVAPAVAEAVRTAV